MRRIVSVWLIDWPIAVWRRSAMRARRPASPPDPALDPKNPFALILKNSRGAAILLGAVFLQCLLGGLVAALPPCQHGKNHRGGMP